MFSLFCGPVRGLIFSVSVNPSQVLDKKGANFIHCIFFIILPVRIIAFFARGNQKMYRCKSQNGCDRHPRYAQSWIIHSPPSMDVGLGEKWIPSPEGNSVSGLRRVHIDASPHVSVRRAAEFSVGFRGGRFSFGSPLRCAPARTVGGARSDFRRRL